MNSIEGRLSQLPTEICYHIMLFLIKPKTKLIWCHACGESVKNLCKGMRCNNCCEHYCVNRGHFYRNIYQSRPLTGEELALAILHLPVHRT